MRSINSVADASVLQSNGTTSISDSTRTPWISGLPTASLGFGADVNTLDYRLSDNLAFFQELAEAMQHRYHLTVPTGWHSMPENSLPFHTKTSDSELFYSPPQAQPQDSIPSTADNSLDVWDHATFPWFDLREFPQCLPAVIPQSSTESSLVTSPPKASSKSPGAYHCEWIENDVRCGQTISGVMRELSTHLHNAHNVQGNEKKMLVCLWRGCNQELQRCNMKRHIATRHLDARSHCNICFKSFSRQDAMKKHARECHGN